ncbi:MAG: hypothetical protein C5B49_14305 [Bdellovibrio sp.]|nr:MAG: hypothetical protein C5B49_14305 [Bdellovibrio sp.]
MRGLKCSTPLLLILLLNLWLLGSPPSWGFIPGSKFIAGQWVSHAGSGVYVVEQDVVFSSGSDSLTLREIWQVNGEGQMRVTVQAPKEWPNHSVGGGSQFTAGGGGEAATGVIQFQSVYNDGHKFFVNERGRQSKALTDDFVEKYFYVRNRDSFINHLLRMKVLLPLPPPPPAPKVAKAKLKRDKKGDKNREPDSEKKEFNYPPEVNVRLSRVGGSIAYALGVPSPVEGEPLPGFWIEQDLFFLRKFRLPSKVEVQADNYTAYAHGLSLPHQRTVRWNQRSVQINIVKVNGLGRGTKGSEFSPSTLSQPIKFQGLRDPEIAQSVEEFYQRFR